MLMYCAVIIMFYSKKTNIVIVFCNHIRDLNRVLWGLVLTTAVWGWASRASLELSVFFTFNYRTAERVNQFAKGEKSIYYWHKMDKQNFENVFKMKHHAK